MDKSKLPTPAQLNNNSKDTKLEAIRGAVRQNERLARRVSPRTSMVNNNNANLVLGEGDAFDETGTNPFTGVAIVHPGHTDDNGTWNIFGKNAGTLQFGLSATDGKAYAGAGAVVLDEDGVSVNVTATETNLNSYKIKDSGGDVIGVLGGRKSTDPDAINIVGLRASAVSGRNPQLFATAEAVSGKNATAYFGASIESGNTPSIQIDASANEIYLSADTLKTLSGYISSGTYTPTATGVTNMGTSSGWAANYYRVHNMVTVWGTAAIDPTTVTTLTEVRITLPVASALTTSSDLSGTMGRNSSATGLGLVVADVTNDQALLRWVTDSAGSVTYNFHFSYIIK